METKGKLIYANELMDSLKKRVSTAYPNELWGLMLAQDLVEDAYPVDAEEVVRCKNCQFNKPYLACDDSWPNRCTNPKLYSKAGLPDDFYCAFGKKKGEQDED